MENAQRFVFVFMDGVGLGDPGSPANPLRDSELTILANFRPPDWLPPEEGGRPESLPEVQRNSDLPHGGRVVATDASMGIPGLPQSATGQTAIFTGENAALAMDRHMYGYPTPTLQKIIMRASILKRLTEAGRKGVFLNAFRQIFFDLGEDVWKKPLSATTWTNRAAGLPFKSMDDLKGKRAVYQDITHDSLQHRGIGIPLREPEEAGEILARASEEHDFTLFEFFQTDKAGHTQDEEKALHELRKLERFLASTLDTLDLEETTCIITSDHGNIEDLSRKMHTHNPVPTLVFGRDCDELAAQFDRLERFTPEILQRLWVKP